MRDLGSIWRDLDWLTIGIFMALALYGWVSIYAAIYEPGNPDYSNIFSLDISSGKQFLWILISIVLASAILVIDFKFYFSIPYIVYGVVLFFLILVLIIGKEINGAKSWFEVGGFTIQPSEFAKFATALAVAKFIDSKQLKYYLNREVFLLLGIILLPSLLILQQNETGTVLVFSAFFIVLYLDGLHPLFPISGITLIILFVISIVWPPMYIIIGLAGILVMVAVAMMLFGLLSKNLRLLVIMGGCVVVFSVVVLGANYFVEEILQPHQQKRVRAMVDPTSDPKGINYQTNNSITAISSGGSYGKGYLQGDLTQGDFVPEQYTDFIFTTIGEEHGFVGTLAVILLYVALMVRIGILTRRQKSHFARVYGYSIIAILFFHFAVNIGMTIGFAPVIGIPLPFFSYGGSSLWGFTILLFIFLKLDMHRGQILGRD